MTKLAVKSEPLTYEPLAPRSFFLDCAREATGDLDARARLERHQKEMEVELRALTTTLGSGGEWAPPLWLIDRFKTAAFAGRPFADLLQPIPLPRGAQSVNVPKFVGPPITGGGTGVQAAQGGAVDELDPTTTNVSSPVVTIAGQMDVAQQLFDLTPIGFDAAAYVQLNRDYNAKFENQLINGTGVNGQLLGLANFALPGSQIISGSGIINVSGAANALWPLTGQAFSAVGNNRGLAPEFWLMTPRRWAWIAAAQDQSYRPIASPGGGTFHPDHPELVAGGQAPFGPILNLPVYCDGAIPAGTAADSIYCVRSSDMLLFESAALVQTSVNATSGTLQVRLSLHKYAAFAGNTYTTGVSVITSLPAPSGF